MPESLNKINFQSLYRKLTKFFICFYTAYGQLSRLFAATNLETDSSLALIDKCREL